MEKVRLLKVLLQPGTGWTKVKQVREEYCTLEKGTLTSIDYTSNSTNVYSIGSFWSPRNKRKRSDDRSGIFFLVDSNAPKERERIDNSL